jgi:hypothetical protein
MTALSANDEALLELLTRPPASVMAKHFPNRILVHTISCLAHGKEAQRITQALSAGGYEYAHWINPWRSATESLVGRMYQIANDNGIVDVDAEHTFNDAGDLIIILSFANELDPIHFKLLLP